MTDTLLVLNAGSSSIKFQLFGLEDAETPVRHIKGQIEGVGTAPRLIAKDKNGKAIGEESWPVEVVADVPSALDKLLAWLVAKLGGALPAAVGHRVAHGGATFDEPAAVDDRILRQLEALIPLAPLHQPNNLAPIHAIRARRPELLQVACFDTAFHRGRAEVALRYALPDALHQEGIRRYGFHGLSYEYIAKVLPAVAPEVAQGRVVVAHLGSGASLCALRAGQSIDTTMGFTALDGLPMGTRCGQIDPGILLYLLQAKGWSPERLERFLYRECGLKGLSGVSNDMRDLLASEAPLAGLAIDCFVYRTLLGIGALTAALGGLDGLVFTAGIGENAPEIRERISKGLAWIGLELDGLANRQNGPRISTARSRVSVWAIPTDEEAMIARHTQETRLKLAMV